MDPKAFFRNILFRMNTVLSPHILKSKMKYPSEQMDPKASFCDTLFRMNAVLSLYKLKAK